MNVFTLFILAVLVSGTPMPLPRDGLTLEEDIAVIQPRVLTSKRYLAQAWRNVMPHKEFAQLLIRLSPLPARVIPAIARSSLAVAVGDIPIPAHSVHTTQVPGSPHVHLYHPGPLEVYTCPPILDAARRISPLLVALQSPHPGAQSRINRALVSVVRGMEYGFSGWVVEDEHDWFKILRQVHIRTLLIPAYSWTDSFTQLTHAIIERLVAAATPPAPPGCFVSCFSRSPARAALEDRYEAAAVGTAARVATQVKKHVDAILARATTVSAAASSSELFFREFNTFREESLLRCSGLLSVADLPTTVAIGLVEILQLVDGLTMKTQWARIDGLIRIRAHDMIMNSGERTV